jgi:hypothetical protein
MCRAFILGLLWTGQNEVMTTLRQTQGDVFADSASAAGYDCDGDHNTTSLECDGSTSLSFFSFFSFVSFFSFFSFVFSL